MLTIKQINEEFDKKVKPQAQKPVDKDTSPIMISSSEQDDSSPLKLTSPVAGPSSPQPMASSHQDHLRQDYQIKLQALN